jgi:hypothetical protein
LWLYASRDCDSHKYITQPFWVKMEGTIIPTLPLDHQSNRTTGNHNLTARPHSDKINAPKKSGGTSRAAALGKLTCAA